MSDTPSSPRPASRTVAKRTPRTLALNFVIVILAGVVGYLAYGLVERHLLRPPVDVERTGSGGGSVIQLDVLNGSGIQGAATKVTGYLRERGYDVVEMRNYKTFDVDESLVIDRVGNLANAEKVAYALGIRKNNIIQQLNQDYFVDVSVVIGKDFASLKPSR